MNLSNLLKESVDFSSFQSEAKRKAANWEATGLLEGLSDKNNEKSNMAVILESQASRIMQEQSNTNVGGATFVSGAGEQWAGVALPLVRKIFKQFSTKDFVSIQPLQAPSGLVFYLDFKYGTTRNGRISGDVMYGNVSTANNKMGVDEDVSGGLYGAGQFGYTINQLTGSVTATVADAGIADVGYDAGIATGSYDVVTIAASEITTHTPTADLKGVRAFRLAGAQVLPEFTRLDGGDLKFVVADGTVSAGTVTLEYHAQPVDNNRGDFEDNPAGSISIPEINVELASEPIVAKTRKLQAKWTPEFSQDLQKYQNVDAEAELTSILSEYISMEIDMEILDMLIQDAATTERWSAENNKVWTGSAWDTTNTSDFFNTQGQWFQTLGTKMQKISNKIHQKTFRGGANFAVVSPDVATILESIPGYAAQTDGTKEEFAMGVEKVGTLNSRFKIYKNPFMTENIMLMGFRGSQFLEAGAVYAPYVPLMMTPLVHDPETYTPRKAIMTRYAKKMLRPEFYGKIYISDLGLI